MTRTHAARGGREHLVPVIAVLALCGLAYANSLAGPFVFDDVTSIVKNPHLRDLSSYLPGGPGFRAAPNRWVGYLSFALNHRFGGLDVLGYHAVNGAIHAACSLLVYALVRLAFRAKLLAGSALAPDAGAVAFASAALFATHPVQTQAVTYVVQRFSSLAALLVLAAVVSYAVWRLRQERGDATPVASAAGYALVLLCSVLAMGTKETSFTLPVVILLLEGALFGSPFERRKLAWLLPLAATALLVPLGVLHLGGPGGKALAGLDGATRVQTELSRLGYLRTEIPVVATYLRLLLLPVGQNLDHDVPIAGSFLEPRVLASAAVLAGLAGLAAWLFLRTSRDSPRPLDPSARLAAFGIACFFVGLSVESSVIPIVDLLFEHRVYFPSIGVFVAAATGGAWAVRRLAPARVGRWLTVAAVAAALVLAGATHLRNRVWADELSLWGDTVAKSPGKRRPHYNLGLALARAHRPQEAAAQFRAAIAIDPSYGESYNNLAAALTEMGRVPEATAVLQTAIRVKPDNAEALYNLGRIYLTHEQRYAEAEGLFRRALELDRNHGRALANLGATLNRLGRFEEAIRVLEDARETVAGQPEARFNLGVAYAAAGDLRAAEGEIVALQALAPGLAEQLRGFVSSRAVLEPRPPPSAP